MHFGTTYLINDVVIVILFLNKALRFCALGFLLVETSRHCSFFSFHLLLDRNLLFVIQHLLQSIRINQLANPSIKPPNLPEKLFSGHLINFTLNVVGNSYKSRNNDMLERIDSSIRDLNRLIQSQERSLQINPHW